MRYFLDSEFHEDGRIIDLISIGIVAEDGRAYYAVSSEYDPFKVNDWVRQNVLPKLFTQDGPPPKSRANIAWDIKQLIGDDVPEFWAYYADYDWVVLCQLFGPMICLPEAWPKYCRDLKQLIDMWNVPKHVLLPEPENAHHALADARWVRDQHDVIRMWRGE